MERRGYRKRGELETKIPHKSLQIPSIAHVGRPAAARQSSGEQAWKAARAAEQRGAWDARQEALVVDAVVRGPDVDGGADALVECAARARDAAVRHGTDDLMAFATSAVPSLPMV